jgi:hypothetical protein
MAMNQLEEKLLDGLRERARREQRDAFTMSQLLDIAAECYGPVASSDVRQALWDMIERGDLCLGSDRLVHLEKVAEKASAA